MRAKPRVRWSEGVTFAFADCHDALRSTGTVIERALALGGGAKSDYWLSAIATTLNLPLMLPQAGDFGAALGAARLGMMAASGAGIEIAALPPDRENHPTTRARFQTHSKTHTRATALLTPL